MLNDEKILPTDRFYKRRNFSCIYAIISSNGKKYVGSAKHFGVRMRNHVHQLLNNKHHSIILQNHVNKYGIDDLHFVVLEKCDWNDDIFKIEQNYLDKYNPEFNVLRFTRGATGKVASKETIERLRKSHLGKVRKPESIKKMKETLRESFSIMSEEKRENRKRGGYAKRKKVICNETRVIYNSINEAETLTGCDNLSAVISGKRKHSLGLTFNFYYES